MIDPSILVTLIASSAPAAYEALKKAINISLAEEKVETIQATVREEVVREIIKKGEANQETSPERRFRRTRKVVEQQLSILEQERQRLVPIASREHMLAFVFVVLAGVIFLLAVIFVVIGITSQAIGSFVASIIPGFISAVFFNREAVLEKRLAEITTDMRKSEIVKERLETLETGLSIVPEENRKTFAQIYTDKYF